MHQGVWCSRSSHHPKWCASRADTVQNRLCFLVVIVLVLWPAVTQAKKKGVEALFSTDRTYAVPFNTVYPSDLFTTADATQLTGLRLDFASPKCGALGSACESLLSINELDGFNLQPQLTVRFSKAIDVTTVNSRNFFLIRLGDALPTGDQSQRVVGINQISFHTENNVLSAESDEFLDEHTRYAVVVTRDIRDGKGQAVRESKAFTKFRQKSSSPALEGYRQSVLEAMQVAAKFNVNASDIVAASVFTTQSASALLEKIRDQIKASTPEPTDFHLGPNGERTVFALGNITAITRTQQVKANASAPDAFVVDPFSQFDVSRLQQVPGAIQYVGYGTYQSPNYLLSGPVIPAVGTKTGTPIVQGKEEVFFNVLLPSGTKPLGGWPVAIYGHGLGGTKETSYFLAPQLAARGIATIAITGVGHGSGPFSTLTVTQSTAPAVTFLSGGRGIDQFGDGVIDIYEGHYAAPPRTGLSNRDGLRQTVIDLMQLVRVIERGMDVDGDTLPDLNPSLIYYWGASLGGVYGTTFIAVEPLVRAGVPVVGGGPGIEVGRLSPYFRPTIAPGLASSRPSLINVGGASGLEFNENMPLRNQPPVLDTVRGAFALQVAFDTVEMLMQSGNPVAYAVHLRKQPLAGVVAKPVIISFGRGDSNVPNPTTTAMLRAGDLADRATLYRHDLVFVDPVRNPTGKEVPTDAHAFIAFNYFPSPTIADIGLNAQHQIVEFFASDGQVTIDPDGPEPIFETPIAGPLPEDCGYVVPIPGFTACK